MIKTTPEVTVCRLTIQLRSSGTGSEAEVTYAHTILGPAGDEFVAAFTEAWYARFMQNRETKLNHYLRHGTRL